MAVKRKKTSLTPAGSGQRKKACDQKTAAKQDVDPRICGLRDALKRGWYRLETGELLDGFQITADDIVLDVGCGEGNAITFCALKGAHVVFTDIDPKKISVTAKNLRATPARKTEGFVANSLPLPLPDRYATKILAMEMLEHTANPEKILAELVRVGKPGARYLITVPDSRSETLQKPIANPIYFSQPNHIQIFDKNKFVRLVKNSGLKVERYTTWGFYWTVFMSLFWIVHQKNDLEGAVLDSIKPPYHPVLQSWSNTWAELLKLEGAEKLLESFDQFLPKTQAIIARKAPQKRGAPIYPENKPRR